MPTRSRLSPTLFGRERELATLDRMLDDARCGQSAVLVLRGESGVGKTALLDHLLDRASGVRVAHIAGAELETELAYAGLHQLCAPMLGRLEGLPAPQRAALAVAFGLLEGKPPDRFLVALATLSLLAESSTKQPLLWVVDDVQWLDQASMQALSFVARRVLAEPVAMVFAIRGPSDQHELAGLPELVVDGLDDLDARALLAVAMPGAIDERVRERILAEARGNPLALLELHAGPTPAEFAGGYGVAQGRPLAGRIEGSFTVQLRALPSRTRQLLLIAAADPLGSSASLWRAAERLGLGADDSAPAEEAKLISIGDVRVQFRHPLVRSAIYEPATLSDRRRAHQALADTIDPQVDNELRVWHRAQAAPAPDEAIALELEGTAVRARGRGGIAAAAAFLTRATFLTPDPAQRVRRALAAAHAKLLAGAPEAALELVAVAEAGTSDDLQSAQHALLRAVIAFASRHADAPLLFLAAAARLKPLDEDLAREAYLEAMMAAIFTGRLTGREGADPKSVARVAKTAPPASQPPRVIDLLLDGLVARFSDGYGAAAPVLSEALQELLREYARGEGDPRWYGIAGRVALDLWDWIAWDELSARQIQMLRADGLLTLLPVALAFRAWMSVHNGQFAAAEALLEEARAITGANGTTPPGYIEPVLAAYRGDKNRTLNLVRASTAHATMRAEGQMIPMVHFAAAVLHIGLGEYSEALAATDLAVQHDDLGLGGYALVQRIEAASRLGETEIANTALSQLLERTEATGTELALGLAARSRALLASGSDAEALYRKALTHLERTGITMLLARARLIYGEWLRRENRRNDAREQLRQAYDVFVKTGAEGFAERARRELRATGESVRAPVAGPSDLLTAQESIIARLARDGHTNQEIGTQLFISPRTVEWYLSKIFSKLQIKSRRGLRTALHDIG